MTARLLHPDVERATPVGLAPLQERLWQEQWRYVQTRSSFYRTKLGVAAARELTLDGLRDLPLTDKEEIRASQETTPPYGDYLACAPEQVVRIHRTSGTTGRSLTIGFSQRDVEVVTRLGGRAMFCAGARPGLRIVHCLNYQLWTGGVTDHMIIEASGATVVPFGVGQTRKLLETIGELAVTGIHCTPSYPALLEKVLREEMGREPRSLGLPRALRREAGLDHAAFRSRLRRPGVQGPERELRPAGVMSIFGSQCGNERSPLSRDGRRGGRAARPPFVSASRSARDDGRAGCTHLVKECQPLVRYRRATCSPSPGPRPARAGA